MQLFTQESDRLYVANYEAPIGFASLAIIMIGLVVLWTGYQKLTPWTWFVMFVVVWIFTFPVHILPILLLISKAGSSFEFSRWIKEAVHIEGPSRAVAEQILLFLSMVVGLFLPIKSFFGREARLTFRTRDTRVEGGDNEGSSQHFPGS